MKHLWNGSPVLAILVIAGMVAPCQPAQGWNKAGHMVTGAIAYRVLKKESPGTVPKVIAMLKKNPYYGEKWKGMIAGLDKDADADEFLFMQGARWADDARGDDRFYPEGSGNEFIHFINQPFRPKGTPMTVPVNKEADINLVRAFPGKLEEFKTDTDEVDRAVAMSWVMHLVGDAHQPLHTISLYTEKFQVIDHGRLVGDRGGTRFYVLAPGFSGPTSLHTFWDDVVTTKDDYNGNRKIVADLAHAFSAEEKKLKKEAKELDIHRWVKESYDLAKTKVYFFQGSLLTGTTKKKQATDLPAGYHDAVAPIAQRRVVLAGYRLAGVLKETLGD